MYVWVYWGRLIRASLYVWPRKRGSRRRVDTRCLLFGMRVLKYGILLRNLKKDRLSIDAFVHPSEYRCFWSNIVLAGRKKAKLKAVVPSLIASPDSLL